MSLFNSLAINFNCIKSESYNNNCNVNRVNNKIFWIEEMPSIDSNCIKSKTFVIFIAIITAKWVIESVFRYFSQNEVSDKITWIEKILWTNSNYIENKSYRNNCNKSNYNISDKMGAKKWKSDNLENLE